MTFKYEDIETKISNTTMRKRILNDLEITYCITPNEGYLLHDKLYDEPVMDEVTMEETGKVILGFRKSTATVPVNYDFELNSRQFYAVLETEKPTEPVEVAGDGEATKEDLYNALAELGVE